MRRYADECHHGKEETYLFPALERRGVPLTGCPLGTLAFEHQKGRTMVKHLSESADDYVKNGRASSESLIKSLRSLLELYPNHIWKEDYLLFPMSNKVLSPEDQKELMVQFEEVDNRIGPEVIARLEQRALDFEAAARR
jgi:hemerythrin-like domain-containing protein